MNTHWFYFWISTIMFSWFITVSLFKTRGLLMTETPSDLPSSPHMWWFLSLEHSFRKGLVCYFWSDVQVLHLQILQKINTKFLFCSTALWFAQSPMVMAISTKRKCWVYNEFLMLLCLYCLLTKKYFLSGAIYGLSIHFKIYPIVYSIPFSCFSSMNSVKRRRTSTLKIGSFWLSNI